MPSKPPGRCSQIARNPHRVPLILRRKIRGVRRAVCLFAPQEFVFELVLALVSF